MQERSNEDWISELKSAENSQALEDLRFVLLRGLRYALSGRVSTAHLEALAEDAAQEALIKILASLDTFEGRSRFTTWAQKIAVRMAFTELRRQRWKDISLEELLPEDSGVDYTPPALVDLSPEPQETADRRAALALVERLLAEELTERQRQAMIAVMLHGMPLEEVARRMGTNRNAMYKLLHDARLRLRHKLAGEGYTPQELLAVFEAS